MGWISKLFSKTDEPEMPSPSTGFHDLEGHPVPISLATTDARVARALVHNAATLTAQVYALPANWLSFEVVTISDDEKAYFQLQVLMNHWDEYLVAHSYAFERAVIKKIREDDLNVGRAVRAVLWRVSADAGCPYDEMPEPSAWTSESIKQRGEARDRINRDLYLQHHNASPPALAYAALPLSSDSADRAGRSTMPVKSEHGSELETLVEDRESTQLPDFHDFASTQSLNADGPAKARVDVAIHAH